MDALELAERAAELPAGGGIVAGVAEGGPAGGQRPGRVAQPLDVEGGDLLLEAARAQQDVLGRHPDVLEIQLAPVDWCQLYFEDVRVPAENVLLRAGGFKKQIAAFNVERLGNSARALASGRPALGHARDYSATRRQFGSTLRQLQCIH